MSYIDASFSLAYTYASINNSFILGKWINPTVSSSIPYIEIKLVDNLAYSYDFVYEDGILKQLNQAWASNVYFTSSYGVQGQTDYGVSIGIQQVTSFNGAVAWTFTMSTFPMVPTIKTINIPNALSGINIPTPSIEIDPGSPYNLYTIYYTLAEGGYNAAFNGVSSFINAQLGTGTKDSTWNFTNSTPEFPTSTFGCLTTTTTINSPTTTYTTATYCSATNMTSAQYMMVAGLDIMNNIFNVVINEGKQTIASSPSTPFLGITLAAISGFLFA